MKEHKDEVLLSGKESAGTVDSTTSDEVVTRRGEIEGLFGERDGEDMVVDVVSADMVVDEGGGAKVDRVMEDVGVVKEGNDDVVESRVEALEKVAVEVVSEEGVKGSVEVVKEVIQENVVTAVVSGSDCGDDKSGKKPVIGDSKTGCEASSKEAEAGRGEIEVIESVQEAAGGDHVLNEKSRMETEVLSSSKIQESRESHVVTDEGLVGKDKAEDGVNNQGSANMVVDAGACEDNVHVNTKNTESQAGVGEIKKESFQSTTKATTNDSQKSGNGTQVGESKMVVELDRGVTEEKVEWPTESVQEAADGDCVMSEKTGKDEDLDSAKIPDSVTKVDEVITAEGLAGKDETQGGVAEDQSSVYPDKPSLSSEIADKETCAAAAVHEDAVNLDQNDDQMNKEESSQSATEVGTHDASNSGKETEVGDSKMENEPETVKGDTDVIDKGDEKETLEQPVSSVQEVTKGDPDSSKTPQSSIMASLGLEEVDVVAVDEGLEEKNEAQDRVPVEPSLVNPDHQTNSTKVEDGTGEVDLKAEVDSPSKNENSSIKPVVVDACNKVDEVAIAQKEQNPDVQVSTDGGVSVENQSINANTVTDSSKPDIVARTEPESSIDKMTPGIANKVVEKDTGGQNFEVEPAPVGCESSGFQVDQGLNANHSNPGNDITASHIRVPDSTVEVPTTGEPQSYSEDTGMDIDEVLGWKDEIPSVQEDQQKVDPTNLSNVEVKETEALEPTLESEQWNKTSVSLQQSCYFHPPENEGIKQESSRRHGVDKSASVSSFEPDMLVDYVRSLAKSPYGEGDKMELTMAKAQLLSYGRFKGHRQLAEFQLCGDLLEVEQVIKDETYSEDGSRKRKALDSISDGSEKRLTLPTDTVTPKSSFKVGESIQKVASQLTGPPEQVTGNIVSVQGGPAQLGNQADMLSQLHLAAQDPMKGYGFVDNIVPYFNSHRTAVVNKSRLNSSNDAKKRKTMNGNDPEEFEFDDVNDSYWTDRIIQNYPEDNPLQDNQNGGGQHQIVAYEQEKPVKPTRRSNKKRFFSSNHEIEAKEQSELIERRRKNLATEVLMKFTEGIYFPSEIHLNKMFRRFGPLMESETEVDRAGGRARVVFKKCSDAEVAHSSAGKFNIFGSINVNYELNYTPLISYKPLPLPTTQDPPHAC